MSDTSPRGKVGIEAGMIRVDFPNNQGFPVSMTSDEARAWAFALNHIAAALDGLMGISQAVVYDGRNGLGG